MCSLIDDIATCTLMPVTCLIAYIILAILMYVFLLYLNLYWEYNTSVRSVPARNCCPVIVSYISRLKAQLVCSAIFSLCCSVCVPCVDSILCLRKHYISQSVILFCCELVYILCELSLSRLYFNCDLYMLCSFIYILIRWHKCCKELLCSNVTD